MKEIERESQVFRFAVNVHFPSAFFSFFFFPRSSSRLGLKRFVYSFILDQPLLFFAPLFFSGLRFSFQFAVYTRALYVRALCVSVSYWRALLPRPELYLSHFFSSFSNFYLFFVGFFIISSHGLVLVLFFEVNWKSDKYFFRDFNDYDWIWRLEETSWRRKRHSFWLFIFLKFCLNDLECAGSVGAGHRRPVEEPALVVGSAVRPPRFVCSGRPGHPVEEARGRQQRTGCLRGAHEGLCQRYRSQVLPRRQLPRRK